jgi:hypothetical protein
MPSPYLVLEPPRRRGDCANGPRPCPWRSCRFNLTTEPKRPPDGPSCVLDTVDAGGATIEEVAAAFGLTHQRISQIQERAIERILTAAEDFR